MTSVDETLKKLEQARQQASAAQGALQVHMAALAQLGYSTLEEAEAALAQLGTQAAEAEAVWAAKLAEFRAQWGHLVQV